MALYPNYLYFILDLLMLKCYIFEWSSHDYNNLMYESERIFTVEAWLIRVSDSIFRGTKSTGKNGKKIYTFIRRSKS